MTRTKLYVVAIEALFFSLLTFSLHMPPVPIKSQHIITYFNTLLERSHLASSSVQCTAAGTYEQQANTVCIT